MIASIGDRLDLMESGIRGARPADKVGSVRRVTGLIIESEGPEVSIGQTCAITSSRHNERTEAEVVGFRDNMVLLMALESGHRIHNQSCVRDTATIFRFECCRGLAKGIWRIVFVF